MALASPRIASSETRAHSPPRLTFTRVEFAASRDSVHVRTSFSSLPYSRASVLRSPRTRSYNCSSRPLSRLFVASVDRLQTTATVDERALPITTPYSFIFRLASRRTMNSRLFGTASASSSCAHFSHSATHDLRNCKQASP